MFEKKHNKILKIFFIIIGVIGLMVAVYFIPPVHERLSWRIANLRAKIYYLFNPPGETSFSPAQQEEMEAIVHQTQTAIAPTPTQTIEPSITPTYFISPTPTQTLSPTPSPTPLPDSVRLEGVVHEYQKFNNCGPANLSMALSYWGWEGDQMDTAEWLKPNYHDRNVMPYEMLEYVESQTGFNAIIRYGGDVDMIKSFIAAGFPVIVEKGFEDEVPQHEWMGHYGVITGYDDEKMKFYIQDSYVQPDYPKSYEDVNRHWRSFNYVYMVIYPPERQQEVLQILGPHADIHYNFQYATEKALNETSQLDDRELFFAWYNYGSNLVNLNDYYGAARAFDQAFNLKNELWPEDSDPKTSSFDPWRIIWYQTGPYFAYYYTGRYQDVIDLANQTFVDSVEDAIEESWVWRGRAKVALGDVEGAIEDFREALKWHPGWWVAEDELQYLGVEP